MSTIKINIKKVFVSISLHANDIHVCKTKLKALIYRNNKIKNSMAVILSKETSQNVFDREPKIYFTTRMYNLTSFTLKRYGT